LEANYQKFLANEQQQKQQEESSSKTYTVGS